MASFMHLPGMRYLRNGELDIQEQNLHVPMGDPRLPHSNYTMYPTRVVAPWRSDDLLSGYPQQPMMDSMASMQYTYRSPAHKSNQVKTGYHLHSQQPSMFSQHSPYFTVSEHQEREVQQLQYQHIQHIQLQQQMYQEQQKERRDADLVKEEPVSQPRGVVRKRRRPPHSYASLIAQAILTSRHQKLMLKDIYDWVQRKYPNLYESNETGWQNTIRHNLSLNRCFRKVPRLSYDPVARGKGSKGGYWAVDMDQLGKTSFGRQILDSGMLQNAWSINNGHPSEEFELQGFMSPLYPSTTENTRSPSSYSETFSQEKASTAAFLAKLSQPLSALSTPSLPPNDGSITPSSSKTYSQRDVSPASSTSIHTPLMSMLHLNEHKLENVNVNEADSILVTPSLMRVNNILN
ncbi:fork head domain-containing protein [Spinellus fusiger]|nr:fork head domain-containing protein [Spinellus fusiger]